MTPQVFKSRVQWFANVLMTVTTLYLIYYLYNAFLRAYRFCFGEPELWANHWRVEEAAVIEQSTRMTYFGVWVTVIVMSAVATLAALRLLNLCRQGRIFDAAVARTIQMFGILLIIAMIGDQVFGAVDLFLLTKHNPVQQEPIQWVYDSADFKTMALALVMFLFGWVMRDAIEIDKTNKEFV
ncbi:DUF2975 domain-containing protein [Amylibacter sp. IMCC11727]|uniref:DUF2975 domain-containing protein n=1 Tax=Amylibacter sp. IMCC11727 TaxID=3039851 RepID=UPI00244DA307|nr:DUF2975 domain-containing protein [Amylibacter sp. IMCC11727]WGI22632.1 hypothetical protein QBD29_04240 [Amylibacter sp. IMCC11727]